MEKVPEKITNITENHFSSKWYKKLSEDPELLTEQSSGDLSAIRNTFEPILQTIGCVPSKEALDQGWISKTAIRSYGSTWVMNPARGSGECWYGIIDSDAVLISMDLKLNERAIYRGPSVELIGFGCYGHDMTNYFIEPLPDKRPALIGYRWTYHLFQQICEAHAQFKSCSLSLRPKALERYSCLLGVTPKDILSAISQLDGTRELSKLKEAMNEFVDARPSKNCAPAYYHAKLIELLVLLIDGVHRDHTARSSRSVQDWEICEEASQYIKANLDQDLSTRTLEKVLHLSAARLIDAFRRSRGTTPQDFIRKQRVEFAAMQLLDGNETICNIAKHVGYANQGAFSEAFKAMTGLTPSRFRRDKLSHPCQNLLDR
ncbi:AraC family transcriptional regulator [Atopobium sp. oral taxon 810]|uniref:helix-turn-helix domain-containing protein n=1 Tax=Atopobium sp. oral taxon 810 TaxID=712158 RepID=UPI0003980409|nr:AraC family transcriptional regulator [Atopobium sp. oral taxon 810]ERI05291.1 transcriptional regulator, AraC family [Atopobium sp. oral taxon 810 str. F0209]